MNLLRGIVSNDLEFWIKFVHLYSFPLMISLSHTHTNYINNCPKVENIMLCLHCYHKCVHISCVQNCYTYILVYFLYKRISSWVIADTQNPFNLRVFLVFRFVKIDMLVYCEKI